MSLRVTVDPSSTHMADRGSQPRGGSAVGEPAKGQRSKESDLVLSRTRGVFLCPREGRRGKKRMAPRAVLNRDPDHGAHPREQKYFTPPHGPCPPKSISFGANSLPIPSQTGTRSRHNHTPRAAIAIATGFSKSVPPRAAARSPAASGSTRSWLMFRGRRSGGPGRAPPLGPDLGTLTARDGPIPATKTRSLHLPGSRRPPASTADS